MKRVVFLGSILGTMAVFLVACFFVLTTLIWLVRQWEPASWVVWVVGLGLMGGVVGIGWRWWRLPVERRFRFSLRGMLLGITLLALWFGTAGVDFHEWSPRNRARWEVFEAGGVVEAMPQRRSGHSWARYWLFRSTGYDPWWKPNDADIRSDRAMSVLMKNATELPDIERISFGGTVTDASLAEVGGFEAFPKLWFCQVKSPLVTNAGLKHLGECDNLRGVNLDGCGRVTDAGLAHLVGLNLELLLLRSMSITDAGLAHVGRIHRLEYLEIEAPVTDAGLLQLHDLEKLWRIHLSNTRVTEQGYLALWEALPDCRIIWNEESFPQLSQIERIEVWHSESKGRRIVTIVDRDRIVAVRSWLRTYEARSEPKSGWKWTDYDGASGARFVLRFAGPQRTLWEVVFGNGVYHTNEFVYRPLLPADEDALCKLLRIYPEPTEGHSDP